MVVFFLSLAYHRSHCGCSKRSAYKIYCNYLRTCYGIANVDRWVSGHIGRMEYTMLHWRSEAGDSCNSTFVLHCFF